MNRRSPSDDFNLPDEFAEAAERFQRWSGAVSFASRRWRWAFLILFLVLWLTPGLYVVGPGERGVVMLFGKVVEQTEPGLRYYFPSPLQSHETIDIAQVRRAEIGIRSGAESGSVGRPMHGDQAVPQEALMHTGDENMVDAQLFVQYRVQDPVKSLFAAHRYQYR